MTEALFEHLITGKGFKKKLCGMYIFKIEYYTFLRELYKEASSWIQADSDQRRQLSLHSRLNTKSDQA
jgi:hypothetical protein